MTESIRLEKERLAKDMEAEKWKTLLFFALLPAVHAGEMFIAFLIGCLIIFLISAMRGFGEKNKIGLWGIFLFIAACVYYFYIVGGFVLVRLLFDKLGSPCSYSHFAYYEWLKPPPVFLYMDSTESVFVGSLIAGPIVAALVLWISSYIRPKKGVFWRFWYLRTLLALIIGGVVAVILAQINPPAEPEMLWSMYKIVGIFTSILAFIIITLSWWIFGWRITRLFLLTTFLGFVTLLAAIFRYAYYLPMIVFALTAPIIAVVKPNEGSVFKTIFRFFSSKPDVAAVRNKCLKLTVPFIAVYWLIFVALSPWVAKDIKLQTSEFLPTKQTVALSESNQAYRELMSMFDANGLRKEDICHRLGLVMPEDLPSVLQKLKHKSFADPYGYSPWSFSHATKQEKVRMEKQIERARRWNNDDLILAMNGCGRDTVGTITGFMDDPNSQWALVARAKLGDSSVKEKLKQLLQSSTQNGFADNQERQIDPNNIYAPSPPRTSEIIGAIACISMPDEAVQYFLDYVLNRDIYDLTSNDSRFFMGLSFLPTSQANAVIKTFLDKAIAWQPPTKEQGHYNPESVLYLLDNIIGLYGDEQIAQDVFKVMLLVAEDTKHFFKPHEISPYFTIESAPLLKQGLDSKNNDMRAWCVWQLRKVGYKFDKTELDKLMRDESWKVRANAAFAGGKEVASLAAKDKNALVRLVGGF